MHTLSLLVFALLNEAFRTLMGQQRWKQNCFVRAGWFVWSWASYRETAGGFYGSDAKLHHITVFLSTQGQIISREDPHMENSPLSCSRHLHYYIYIYISTIYNGKHHVCNSDPSWQVDKAISLKKINLR